MITELTNKSQTEIRRSNEGSKLNGRTVEGYAFKFNVESRPINDQFTEIIRQGSLTNEDLRKCDVRATFNHSEDKVPL